MELKNIKIESIDHQGRGIAKINGKVYFVKNALIGEVVDIKILEEHKKYNLAEAIKIIKASNDRREVKCPYFFKCGGCDLLHMKYEAQINFKTQKVKNILKKYADIEVREKIIPSDKEYNYRNKITLHCKNNHFGFYENKTNNIIEIEKCLIADKNINNVLKKIQSNSKNIILRTNGKEVIYKENEEILKTINNYKFKIHLNSFFQINDYICSKIFEILQENIKKDEIVLDLYSGVSTLSIVAAKKAKKVYAVEENKYAYINAKENLKLNNVSNVELINKKVENIINNTNKEFNTIILDPPRKGLHKTVTNYLLSKKFEKIIYISCNPMTLVRDLNFLKSKYVIEKFYILDMFPNTYHVECMAVLVNF